MKQFGRTALALVLSMLFLLTGCSGTEPLFFDRISSSRPLIQDSGESSGPESSELSEPASSEPSSEPAPEPVRYSGELELPVNGASGYAAVSLYLREEPDASASAAAVLEAGAGFTILEESGEWWRVRAGETEGWVEHADCLINLPDVIPSIVYNVTNSYSSLFRSSGRELPGVTGQMLYESRSYNERLGREEFTVAVQYRMAKKICAVQQSALADGYTLILYEGFRPYSVQLQVSDSLSALMEEVPEVRAGVETEQWSINWFIATGVSNHQQGYAIDVSLGRVGELTENVCGNYLYDTVSSYEELAMPTAMHELSIAAASMARPVTSKSPTGWRKAAPAASMNEAAFALQDYCVSAGLTPLASEWWHFNDLDCLSAVDDSWTGDFVLSGNYSVPPE